MLEKFFTGVQAGVLPAPLPIDFAENEALYAQTVGSDARSVLFTSALPGEGVSTLAYALAQRAASAGLRVLLADFNVHNSFPARFLRLPVRSWQLGDAFDWGAIYPIPDRTLDILPAPLQGSFAIPQRSLATVERTIEIWRDRYDMIVADAPCLMRPNSSGISSALLARAFDACCLVVASGETPSEAVRRAVDRLEEQGARPCGVILNDRSMPSLRAEIERQLDKLGWIGRRMKGFPWATVRGLPVFDEGY